MSTLGLRATCSSRCAASTDGETRYWSTAATTGEALAALLPRRLLDASDANDIRERSTASSSPPTGFHQELPLAPLAPLVLPFSAMDYEGAGCAARKQENEARATADDSTPWAVLTPLTTGVAHERFPRVGGYCFNGWL
jgi:hypothetical protein